MFELLKKAKMVSLYSVHTKRLDDNKQQSTVRSEKINARPNPNRVMLAAIARFLECFESNYLINGVKFLEI